MSLRVRLVLLTAFLVTAVVVVLSWLYLSSLIDSLSTNAVERSELASGQIKSFLIERINKDILDYPRPKRFEQTKSIWREIVSTDPDITATLERTMTYSSTLVEINIYGDDNEVLASSNPLRVGRSVIALPTFQDWRQRPFYRRLFDLAFRREGLAVPDYEVVVPLGIPEQEAPIFTVQVVASSVLLRSGVVPQVRSMAGVGALALLASLFLTTLATTGALQPIRRIEQTIDRIAQGDFRGEDGSRGAAANEHHTKELAAVESKLNLLGQKYTGVQQNATNLKASMAEMIERMASQLDVASRLAAISKISGGVAHEIKNPLNAISLRLDLLRARAEAGGHDLIPEIDVLSKEVRRLDRVVKTFLDFSRPVETHFADVDLAALASEVTSLMGPQGKSTGIALTFRGPASQSWNSNGYGPAEAGHIVPAPDGPGILTAVGVPAGAVSGEDAFVATIRGDADMLKQAVLNLVTNALEALKRGGKVGVSVTREGESVILEVADDGPGIPAEARDKVFQLYFTTKEKGSGIGLALVYRAVQLHNGTVDFISETGRGTTFRLRFPLSAHYA